jgi:MFS family permease
MAVGMVVGGRLSDSLLRSLGHRRGRALVPPAGLLAGAVLVLVGSRLSMPLAVAGCFALAVAAVGATEGPCWATAVELGGRRGGSSAGIFNTGGNLLGLIAPVVTPWVAEDLGFGWSAAVALGSIACLAGAVPWLWIDPTERPREDEPISP